MRVTSVNPLCRSAGNRCGKIAARARIAAVFYIKENNWKIELWTTKVKKEKC